MVTQWQEHTGRVLCTRLREISAAESQPKELVAAASSAVGVGRGEGEPWALELGPRRSKVLRTH